MSIPGLKETCNYDGTAERTVDEKEFAGSPKTSPSGDGTQVERSMSVDSLNAQINSRFDENGVPM